MIVSLPIQLDALYVEALYTIKHRIGRRTADGDSLTDNDLYNYVQTAFKITPGEHARLMTKASQEKVGINRRKIHSNSFISTICHLQALFAKLDANSFECVTS
jgi:hypothetical protein